jgi:hypothetical protein
LEADEIGGPAAEPPEFSGVRENLLNPRGLLFG